MPGLDGTEVLARIRSDSRTKCIPVVILSTSTDQQDILRSFDFGANSYVAKPVAFEAFGRVLGEIGVYWLRFNRPPGQGLAACDGPGRCAACEPAG